MIHPRPRDVFRFLWDHLEKDMRVLGQALAQNVDDTAVTIHLILRACSQAATGDDVSCSSGLYFFYTGTLIDIEMSS